MGILILLAVLWLLGNILLAVLTDLLTGNGKKKKH